MKHKKIRLAAVFFLSIFALPVCAFDEPIPRSLKAFTEETLSGLGKNPVIVREVVLRNSDGTSEEDIKVRDNEWQSEDGVNRFMLDLMSNDCALVLHDFESRHPYVVESFVTDRWGANVGQTEKTSDYWQGDEAKFTESYHNGRGAIYYGEVEFDSSSNEIVVQVSVPVMNANTAIGTITFSISLDKWEKR